MKKIAALLLFSAALTLTPAFSQKNNKFGHINSAELLSLMPERKVAAARMDTMTKEIQKQMEDMMAEYRSKQDGLEKGRTGFSALVLKDKEDELASLGQRIQNFQQQAQSTLEQKEQELTEPIVTKAKKAIEQVAKENSYTYVFDTSAGALLFWEESDNLIALVKKKLNLP
jgi:outer membrane protein